MLGYTIAGDGMPSRLSPSHPGLSGQALFVALTLTDSFEPCQVTHTGVEPVLTVRQTVVRAGTLMSDKRRRLGVHAQVTLYTPCIEPSTVPTDGIEPSFAPYQRAALTSVLRRHRASARITKREPVGMARVELAISCSQNKPVGRYRTFR